MPRVSADAWFVRSEQIATSDLRTRCLEWLSADERSQHDRLKTPKIQHDYLVAHALCRASLSRYSTADPTAWKFKQGRHGKPEISKPAKFRSLHFNLAHTDGLAICLVSRVGPVGVDVERITPEINVTHVARHFLTSQEEQLLLNIPEDRRIRRFFELWVLKEACLKGIGEGLGHAHERFTIALDGNGSPQSRRNWQFALRWLTTEHVAAAAVRVCGQSEPIHIQWLDAQNLFEARVPIVS